MGHHKHKKRKCKDDDEVIVLKIKEKGSCGPPGCPGPKGCPGAQGPTGPTGTGCTGPASEITGPTGPCCPGPQGPTGPQSTLPGPPGPQGPSGPQGPQGQASTVPGPTGPQGPFGTGCTGPASTVTGPTGPVGPMGAGAPGPTGPPGPSGTGLVETKSPISGDGSINDPVCLLPTNSCGESWYWNPRVGAWQIHENPGMTVTTVGQGNARAMYDTVSEAFADGCYFVRVISDTVEAGITNINQAAMIYIDPGVIYRLTYLTNLNNQSLTIAGNQALESSSSTFAYNIAFNTRLFINGNLEFKWCNIRNDSDTNITYVNTERTTVITNSQFTITNNINGFIRKENGAQVLLVDVVVKPTFDGNILVETDPGGDGFLKIQNMTILQGGVFVFNDNGTTVVGDVYDVVNDLGIIVTGNGISISGAKGVSNLELIGTPLQSTANHVVSDVTCENFITNNNLQNCIMSNILVNNNAKFKNLLNCKFSNMSINETATFELTTRCSFSNMSVGTIAIVDDNLRHQFSNLIINNSLPDFCFTQCSFNGIELRNTRTQWMFANADNCVISNIQSNGGEIFFDCLTNCRVIGVGVPDANITITSTGSNPTTGTNFSDINTDAFVYVRNVFKSNFNNFIASSFVVGDTIATNYCNFRNITTTNNFTCGSFTSSSTFSGLNVDAITNNGTKCMYNNVVMTGKLDNDGNNCVFNGILSESPLVISFNGDKSTASNLMTESSININGRDCLLTSSQIGGLSASAIPSIVGNSTLGATERPLAVGNFYSNVAQNLRSGSTGNKSYTS